MKGRILVVSALVTLFAMFLLRVEPGFYVLIFFANVTGQMVANRINPPTP